jgi:hypothetical protein
MNKVSSICLVLICLVSQWALSAIPRSAMILQRTADNAGKGIYQIELELQFPGPVESTVVRETWLIEDSQNMKVHVSGTKDYKDQVSVFINLANGNRIFGKDTRKASADLFERYFNTRSADALNALLTQEKITPVNAHLTKPFKNSKDAENPIDPFVRLARTMGVVTYAFGIPKDPDSPEQVFPGIWIEQDQFLIRKLRLQSGIEIIADRYSTFSQGLNYPRTRTVRWNGQQVSIQTLQVTAKTKSQFDSFGQKLQSKPESLSLLPNSAYIDDFYKRFR